MPYADSTFTYSGAFATVRLAIDRKTNRQVACKMMKKEFIEDLGFTRHVKQEIQILQELSHVGLAIMNRDQELMRSSAERSWVSGRGERFCVPLPVHGFVS